MRVAQGFAFAFALGAASSVGWAQSLTVGSPAPRLKVDQWLKSTPVTRFSPDKLYVVEFWATWCPTCKTEIPRLTAMAKRYEGKIVFAGVSIAEQQKSDTDRSYIARVRKFVRAEGPKMDYHVAVDRPDGAAARDWMMAAGEHALPTAFVVDRRGRVAWIGSPPGLEPVLTQELRGSYNMKAQAQARRETAGTSLSNDPRSNGTAEAVAVAVGDKDWKKVEDISNMIIAGDPSQEETYSMFKMLALMHLDRTRAHAYAKHLTSGIYKNSTERLAALSEMLLDQDAAPAQTEIALGYSIAKQAMAVGRSPDAWALDAMGNAQTFQHQLKLALASENGALKSLNGGGRYSQEQVSTLRSMVDLHIKRIKAKMALSVK